MFSLKKFHLLNTSTYVYSSLLRYRLDYVIAIIIYL